MRRRRRPGAARPYGCLSVVRVRRRVQLLLGRDDIVEGLKLDARRPTLAAPFGSRGGCSGSSGAGGGDARAGTFRVGRDVAAVALVVVVVVRWVVVDELR